MVRIDWWCPCDFCNGLAEPPEPGCHDYNHPAYAFDPSCGMDRCYCGERTYLPKEPRMSDEEKQINWTAVPPLTMVTFSTHCDHHQELQEARKLIEKREAEIATLTSELSRRFDLLAAILHQQGGRVVIPFEDFGTRQLDHLEVFCWMGDWYVLQDHKYVPEDAEHLPGGES